MFGNRAMYLDGWYAGTVHRFPWGQAPLHPLAEDVWELYDTRADFSLSNDLAAKDPQKLKDLQAAFLEDAKKYRVLPIDDRLLERINPATAGRPDLMGGRTSLSLYGGMTGMSENVFINVKNRSVMINADVTVPRDGAQGTILCQGGRFGGWSLYVNGDRPMYTYNYLGMESYTVSSSKTLPAGKNNVRLEFAYDGGGMGKGGTATLYINGDKAGETKFPKTQPIAFSADETADVGIDDATAVVEAIGSGPRSRFTGTIEKVTVTVK